MASVVILDDRLLIEELLVGLSNEVAESTEEVELLTTTYWYYRACCAAALGAGGHLSGPFARLDESLQQRAIRSLLRLRADIGLPDPRWTVPAMVDAAARHPRLNLLNLEALAVGKLRGATVWLSTAASEGVLPPVLDVEGISWRTITVG